MILIRNAYSNEECKQLVEISKTHGINEPNNNKANGKNLDAFNVELGVYGNLMARFFTQAEIANLEFFGFDIHQMQYGNINYNKYGVGNYYDWHYDRIGKDKNSRCDIKYTGIINVSTEPYTGGNLELFLESETNRLLAEEFTTGSVVFFSSPIPHRVTHVTEGVRESLSYWFQGPKWK